MGWRAPGGTWRCGPGSTISPGQLHALTELLATARINILHVGIHRLGPYTALGRVGLDLIVETRDREHADSVLEVIRRAGYPAEESLGMEPPAHVPLRSTGHA